MEQLFKKIQDEMASTREHYKAELSKLRTGRANINILDEIRVNYGGAPMPLNQVATLAAPDPRLITIQPWDSQLLTEIEKAISKSKLGLTPSNDGKLIRLPIPPMTEERRLDLVKQAKKTNEEAKVRVRGYRRDGNERLKGMQKNGEISEDDCKKSTDRMQKLTDAEIAKIDEILSLKEKEIMKV